MTKTLTLSHGLAAVEARARRSAKMLGTAADTLLVHAAGDLAGEEGAALWRMLEGLRDEGLFRRIGVSAYAADAPLTLARTFKPAVMQVPASLLDQRLIADGTLAGAEPGSIWLQMSTIGIDGTERCAEVALKFGGAYDIVVNLQGDAPLTLTPAAYATRWADGLLADGADVLARYRHREFGRFAAITTREYGDGRITVLGTVPNPALGAELMRWAVPEPVAAGWSIVGSPVRVSSGRVTDGGRVWFVHNWSGRNATVTVPAALTDLDSGAALDVGSTISLAPWSCLTAIER